MTLIDSEAQRAQWLARAEYVRGAIADLRQDITVALQDHPNISPNVVVPLAEADVHLDVAMHEIDEAIARTAFIWRHIEETHLLWTLQQDILGLVPRKATTFLYHRRPMLFVSTLSATV